jgi:hypothetical protein
MGVGRALWKHGGYVALTVIALLSAIFWSLPIKVVGDRELQDPPYARFVEVTVDRIQPLPWTVKNEHGGITARFAVGWIGQRALLIKTDPELPVGLVVRGVMDGMRGEPKTWVGQTPQLRDACYAIILDVTHPDQRTWFSVGSILACLVLLGRWIYLWVRRPALLRYGPPKPKLGDRLDVERPRPDALVARVLWRHGTETFIAYFAAYAMTVMALGGVFVASQLGLDLFDGGSTARHIGLFALGFVISAPVTSLPMIWWVRQRRGELRHVARHGEIVDGLIRSEQTWGTRTLGTFNPGYTDLEIATLVRGNVHAYRCRVRGRPPSWITPRGVVRVLANGEDRYAILIAPTGDDYLATFKVPNARTL